MPTTVTLTLTPAPTLTVTPAPTRSLALTLDPEPRPAQIKGLERSLSSSIRELGQEKHDIALREGKRIAEMELDSAGLRQLVKLKSKAPHPSAPPAPAPPHLRSSRPSLPPPHLLP